MHLNVFISQFNMLAVFHYLPHYFKSPEQKDATNREIRSTRRSSRDMNRYERNCYETKKVTRLISLSGQENLLANKFNLLQSC